MEQLYAQLKRIGIKVVEWSERSYVAFDKFKDEMIAFTRRQKPGIGRKLADARITVRGHTLGFNTEATR